MTVNLPGVLAELQELYPRYQQALVNKRRHAGSHVLGRPAGAALRRCGESLWPGRTRGLSQEPGWGDLLHMISVPMKHGLIFSVRV